MERRMAGLELLIEVVEYRVLQLRYQISEGPVRHISIQSFGSAALAVAIGVAGTPAQAMLIDRDSRNSAAIGSASSPGIAHGTSNIAPWGDPRLHVAIQWCGSACSNDAPIEDDPF